MKLLNFALVGAAAFVAATAGARADDLEALKAQIAGLNSRLAQLESTPAMPAGYRLLTVSETDAMIVPGIDPADERFFSNKATNIGLRPAADLPEQDRFQWTGFVRAAVVYRDRRDTATTETTTTVTLPGPPPTVTSGVALTVTDSTAESYDVVSRAGLKFAGSTDTAVGEVGIRVTLLATAEVLGGNNRTHATVTDDGYWGWWKITDSLTLSGGIAGTLANSGNAFDNRCTCAYIQTGGAFGFGDPSQIRLSYESGPISFAIAVEDEANSGNRSALGVAGEAKYAGDTIGFDLNAGYWDAVGTTLTTSDPAWTVNASGNLALGDFAKFGIAAGVGEDKHFVGNADRYAKVSLFTGLTLGDAVTAEFGGAYTDYTGNSDRYTIGGGLYYTPVEQLTLGLEGSYQKHNNVLIDQTTSTVVIPESTIVTSSTTTSSGRETRADVVAVWRF